MEYEELKYESVVVKRIGRDHKDNLVEYSVQSICGHFYLGEIRKNWQGWMFCPEPHQSMDSDEMRDIVLAVTKLEAK